MKYVASHSVRAQVGYLGVHECVCMCVCVWVGACVCVCVCVYWCKLEREERGWEGKILPERSFFEGPISGLCHNTQ